MSIRWKQIKKTCNDYVPALVYILLVVVFCAMQFAPKSLDWLKILYEVLALLMLPGAVLSARINQRDALDAPAPEADKSVEILIETLLALATGFLLVDAKDFASSSQRPFADKVPEISLVFILVFAVHTVWKSSSLFDDFIARTKGEVLGEIKAQVTLLADGSEKVEESSAKLDGIRQGLDSVRESLDAAARKMKDSADQVEQARYAALAARVMGIKNTDKLMIPGDGQRTPDLALARIAERALDSFQAWIETGYRIERQGGGNDGRQTWWRLMESYHREEVFDVTQLEVATNVRNFAMMLLLTIRNYLGDGKENERTPREAPKRIVLVNVSKFPPKDFYNFPDGSRDDRFYHEPEFFGTYRRALSAVTRHPGIKPVRIFLCGPETEHSPVPAGRAAESDGADLAQSATAAAPEQKTAVGSDDPIKIAYDCSFLNFLPVPLTFSKKYFESEQLDEDPAIPSSLHYLQDKFGHVFLGLPMGVTRALIAPHSRSMPLARADEFDYDRTYHDTGVTKSGLLTRQGCRTQAKQFRKEAAVLLKNGLEPTSSSASDPSEPASFTAQADEAWRHLLLRCLRFGQRRFPEGVNAHAELLRVYDALNAASKHDGPDPFNVANLDESVKPYHDQYWYYVESVKEAFDEFQECQQLVATVVGKAAETAESRRLLEKGQRRIANLVLSLLSRCQAIDSLDKFFEMVTMCAPPPAPVKGSTGIMLGYGENWLHRALTVLEAKAILEDVEKHGPVPLWKLFATDLCGITDPWGEPNESFKRFHASLPNRIRMYDATKDTDEVLNEFMLLGVEKQARSTVPGASPGIDEFKVEDVEWKALIGTYINEPFHTCRIKFDFCGSPERERPPAGAIGGALANSARQGVALKVHVDWVKKVWEEGKTLTGTFQRELLRTWSARVEDDEKSI